MKKFLLIPLLAVALVFGGLLATPKPAEATDTNCTALTNVADDGFFSVYARVCIDVSVDGQSVRSRIGLECRYQQVRDNKCRFDLSNAELYFNGSRIRNEDLGIQPPTGWTDGGIWYGSWANPSGGMQCSWLWKAGMVGMSVRFSDNSLLNMSSLWNPNGSAC